MSDVQSTQPIARSWLSNNRYMAGAFLFCFLFGGAMVMNIGMAGEATWFWYATLLHQGVKLYGDLHLALQPLYVLETDGWMLLTGRSTLAYEGLALVHVLVLCLGIWLLLKESPWPDWSKACIFAAAFFLDIYFLAVRFDDFHVVNDIFLLYSMIVLLRLYHAVSSRKVLVWSAVAGILSGLSFMNRSTDGGTLLLAAGLCVPFLAPRRKFLSTALYFVFVALSMAAIFWLTGDTFHDYLSNSILHAASAKGGTGTVFQGPYLAVLDNLYRLTHSANPYWFFGVLAVGALARRYWKDDTRSVLTAELLLVLAVGVARAVLPIRRPALWNGVYIASLDVVAQTILYPLCFYVLVRFVRAKLHPERYTWDPREVLVFVPAGALVSAAVSQVTATTCSTVSMMLLFILATFWMPLSGKRRWLTDSLVAVAMVVAVTGATMKAYIPYSWTSYLYSPMFHDRQWYRHPVYGPMYAQTNLLQFFVPICQDIRQRDPSPQPELLSLPYSYANYFCATPPWRGYVQTWFDTSTPATIQGLMQQLDQAPPRWILYERMTHMIRVHEEEYNHGRPIAHRKLDEMIVKKVTTGQWKVVDHKDYLEGDGWYLIETHP